MHLQLDPQDAAGWRPEPPQMALHALIGGRIVSHLVPIGEFAFLAFESPPSNVTPISTEACEAASSPAATFGRSARSARAKFPIVVAAAVA